MDRKSTTKLLSRLLEENINPHNDPRIYWAKEVTFDYGTEHSVRVDYMRFKPVNNSVSGIEKGDFYCYEIKSSVEDFHSKNGHNFIGDYNYYIMPLEVYEKVKDEIPYRVGVLVPYDSTLKSIKAGKRADRKRPALEMLLMMFRSANRDRRLTMAEKEYIERETVYEELNDIGGCDATDDWPKGWDKAIDAAINIIEDMPAADVVPVVRCKDCKFSGSCSIEDFGCMKSDDFCSKGERKDNYNG
ncbi:MAG: hypothetical protein ACI4JF_01095 [Oscillospiraceae bacterium]